MLIDKMMFFLAVPFVAFALNTPSDLVQHPTATTVGLSWEYQANDNKGFKIFRDKRLIATVGKDDRSFIDTELTPNTTYRYTVKATDDERFFTGKIKAYVPELDFNQHDVYNNKNTKTVNTTESLMTAINDAKPYTTILMEAGTYRNVNIKFPKGKHDITIKAKSGSVTIVPREGGKNTQTPAFKFPNVGDKSEQVYNINFIGFKVQGSTTAFQNKQMFLGSVDGRYIDEEGTIHNAQGKNPQYGAYNIYISDITMQDLFMGIYSGLYAHDWTVNNSLMLNSTYSHFWYMMGWHLSVLNSQMEDAVHTALAIRGYYPEGEVHTYISDEIDTAHFDECYGNILVEDRGSRSIANGFLSKDTWTHRIKGNTFNRVKTVRGSENTYVAVAYGIYGDDPTCGAEKTYMPPQHIEISNNIFDNRDEEQRAKNSAIDLNAWGGLNNHRLSSIEGVKIVHNTFYKVAGKNEAFITQESAELSQLRDDEYYENQ